jgi:hypothetical protein
MQEVHKGNCPNGHMNRFGWRNMEKSYFAATNLKHDREQLAGKLRNLRKIWRFCNLA